MMKKFFLAATITFCSYSLVAAKAKIPIGKIEKIEIVADLPDTEAYLSKEGSKEYLELGRLHQEFNIAWIPIWITEEPKLVLTKKEGDSYYELSNEQLDEVISTNKLNKDHLLKLGFFTRYGGKMILLLLIGIIIYGIFSKDKKEDVEPVNI